MSVLPQSLIYTCTYMKKIVPYNDVLCERGDVMYVLPFPRDPLITSPRHAGAGRGQVGGRGSSTQTCTVCRTVSHVRMLCEQGACEGNRGHGSSQRLHGSLHRTQTSRLPLPYGTVSISVCLSLSLPLPLSLSPSPSPSLSLPLPL